MKLLQFPTLADYVEAQTSTNKQKLDRVWVTDAELRWLAKDVRTHIPRATTGICHGVRNGYEVHMLRRLLPGIAISGTDISDTASQFDGVFQWDFHKTKDEWLGQLDFIYSNSYDHSYDPALLFANWLKCLSPAGRCYLQWTPMHSEAGVAGADCFGISLESLTSWLGTKYSIESVSRIRGTHIETIVKSPWRVAKNLIRYGTPGIGLRKKRVYIVVIKNKVHQKLLCRPMVNEMG